MGKVKCPVCGSCMSFLYVDYQRYLYCGFCHTYRQGPNDNLHLVESPYKDRIEKARVVDDPIGDNNGDNSADIVQNS